MNAVIKTEAADLQADYICRRVVNALLRENVHDCVSRAQVLAGSELAFRQQLSVELVDGAWLCLAHLGPLYIPVEPCDFMQVWQLRDLPVICYEGNELKFYSDINTILDCFQQGLSESLKGELRHFVDECQTAINHGVACEQARQQLFRQGQSSLHSGLQREKPDWFTDMMYFERLASFQDHPFYPTARAKLGFSTGDLCSYAPEFGATFTLRWLAVPQALYKQNPATLPTWWPKFSDVGLAENLQHSHCLIPVHPFMQQQHLPALLQQAQLDEQIIWASQPFLRVAATLSVRTVVVIQDPRWHLKLPLSIRTLGAKNIRTIKPSTIKDGHTVQSILAAIVDTDADFSQQLLLTDESRGAEVGGQNFLGFILRHYPAAVEEACLVPVAALVAETPSGFSVFESLAQRFYAGSVMDFFREYVALTLRLHLRLWVRYGIALESNQQNSVLVLSQQQPRLRLLLKDNDAGRILPEQLIERFPEQASGVAALQDKRILVDESLPLAQMFTTITFQLNIAVLAEDLAKREGFERSVLYACVRSQIEEQLTELDAQGEDVALARRMLLEEESQYLKYLLRAASLEDKQSTGASDVNKFYGKSAPNMLLGK